MTFQAPGFQQTGFDVTTIAEGRIPGNGIDKPDLGSIAILLVASGIELTRFLTYEYSQSFLWPSDGWKFSVNTRSLSDATRRALQPGAPVAVTVDGLIQSQGYIDDVTTTGSRSAGTVTTIEGRDWLSPAIDCHVDPLLQFSINQTLLDVLQGALGPFGVQNFVADNDANRNVITGRIYGTKTTKTGKISKNVLAHRVKPYPREGAFNFASRMAQRFGLWIWPGSDAQSVIVSTPDFLQEPRYTITVKNDTTAFQNNVISAHVCKSRKEQPSVIYGFGYGSGVEFAYATHRSGIINPLINAGGTQLQQLQKRYPDIKFYITPQIPAVNSSTTNTNEPGALTGTVDFPMNDPNARPLYLYDSESHTRDELDAFLRREWAFRARKAITATYEIEGHKLGGQAIAVDTIVNVDDDVSNLHVPMWVLSRHFSKNAGGGTKTRLELILPGTMQF